MTTKVLGISVLHRTISHSEPQHVHDELPRNECTLRQHSTGLSDYSDYHRLSPKRMTFNFGQPGNPWKMGDSLCNYRLKIVKLRFSFYILYSTCSKNNHTSSFNFQRLLYLHDFTINIAITPCTSAHRRSTSNATMHSLALKILDFPNSVHCSLPSSQKWSWQWATCLFSFFQCHCVSKLVNPALKGEICHGNGLWQVFVAKVLSRSWECRANCCMLLSLISNWQKYKDFNGISPLTGHIVHHLMASSGRLLNQLQLSLLQASYEGIESILPEVTTQTVMW